MNKLDMAHEMALAIQGTKLIHDMELVSDMAWKYADKMQAEADKRKLSGVPESILKASNSRELDWQPDWSQAPDGFDWWAATADSTGEVNGGWFFSKEPEIGNGRGSSIYYDGGDSLLTESFDYKGDWKESLRKRP